MFLVYTKDYVLRWVWLLAFWSMPLLNGAVHHESPKTEQTKARSS